MVKNLPNIDKVTSKTLVGTQRKLRKIDSFMLIIVFLKQAIIITLITLTMTVIRMKMLIIVYNSNNKYE